MLTYTAMDGYEYIASYVRSKTISKHKADWIIERQFDLSLRKMTKYQKKISDYFKANDVEYISPFPLIDVKTGTICFIDFLLPSYSLLVDIEEWRESPYYDSARETMKIDAMRHSEFHSHIVRLADLKSGDFRCKISGAMLSSWTSGKGRRKSNKRKSDKH
jgi:hypothetical protein